MDKINAVITGVGGYVPEDVLTNEDISKLVDTTDEWIMTRVGIKERRILKGEGLGTSYMGIRAVKQLLEKTNVNPEEIEVILTATTTPDHHFPEIFHFFRNFSGLIRKRILRSFRYNRNFFCLH